MYSFDKIKQLWENIAASKLKGENLDDLENSDIFNEKDKKDILTRIANESEERAQFINKLNKQKVLESIKGGKRPEPKIKVKPMYWYYAAAASIVILLGVTFFFNKDNQIQMDQQPVIVDNHIEIGTDKATLILEDGSKVALEKGTTYQTSSANSNGEEIVYSKKAEAIKKMMYNTLAIPRGGQFHIQLSDGTKVWLNSESQLKYPVAFVKGQARQVELVYGEAYFDVSPSTEHNGAKFRVYHNQQEVEVLGTEFNIKAYKSETNIYTTLVEGSVAIHTNNENKNLIPGQRSNLNINQNTISVTTVDPYYEVSWKEGVFSFQGKRLEDLMKALARWYDMDVVFENEAHKDIKFKGTLRKHQSIEEVMSIIKSTSINNYAINNKTITIK